MPITQAKTTFCLRTAMHGPKCIATSCLAVDKPKLVTSLVSDLQEPNLKVECLKIRIIRRAAAVLIRSLWACRLRKADTKSWFARMDLPAAIINGTKGHRSSRFVLEMKSAPTTTGPKWTEETVPSVCDATTALAARITTGTAALQCAHSRNPPRLDLIPSLKPSFHSPLLPLLPATTMEMGACSTRTNGILLSRWLRCA